MYEILYLLYLYNRWWASWNWSKTWRIAISICNFIIYNGYGLVKNIEANKIIQTIEKIEFDGHELYRRQLENKIRFVNSKSTISKGSYDATIYYVDEIIEKTTVQFSGVYIIKIKNDKFYIDTF